MAKSSSTSLMASVLFLGVIAVGQAAENFTTPMETIRSSNEEISAILAEHDPLDAEGEARVYQVMNDVTDFVTMSTGAIDEICVEYELTDETCGEWKTVFGDLLRIRSIKGVGRYRADHFDYLNEEIDGEQAVVNTLAYFEGEDIALDYELLLREDRWRIVNYVVDDVDTARSWNRRFIRLLKTETVDDVIQRLRDRIDEYQSES
ncbi:MAG TPA: ABC transporter substrate-binding protein [Acidobacteriota bacterium]|nr:ABC transporter substrate-binding protein [Acidobacteriota bacterium]